MADDDSTLPRRQLGRLLHRYRDEVGLSLARAARLVDIGTTTLHRLEKDRRTRYDSALFNSCARSTNAHRKRLPQRGIWHKAALDEAGSRTLLRRMAKEYLA
ncbi:helix-turn-helix domain-containing protein [Nocardia farcinica]